MSVEILEALVETPSFSFKQVEAILAEVFGIAGDKRGTFVARLQQLQKRGLLKGIHTGRGTRVAYRPWHLTEFQYCLDLLDAGVTPGVVETYIAKAEHSVPASWGQSAERSPQLGRPYCTYLMLHRLSHLSAAHEAASDEVALAVSWKIDDILKITNGRPGILIDLAARFSVLLSAIAKVTPEYLGCCLHM